MKLLPSLRLPAPPLPVETVRRDVRACLAAGSLLLERAGVASARLDAECLLAAAAGCARWQLLLEPHRPLPVETFTRYLRLLERRERREPLAYVLGRREFWSLDLAVTADVLVPRPETETLVEAALTVAREARPDMSIVELGTGSGAVAIALATELPGARLVATDVSARALRLARANAEACGVASRIRFTRGNLWRAVNGDVPAGSADLVVCNPPYIPSALLAELMPEVGWEPRVALDGGPDGLRVIGQLLATTPPRLAPGGHLLLEIGADQAAAALRLIAAQPELEPLPVVSDLAGRDRVIGARRRG